MAWVAVSAGSAGAAGGLSILGGVLSAQATRNNAAIVQQVDDLNSQYAELDAYNVQQEGATKADRYQDVIDATLSQQQSEEASKGQSVTFGTASEVAADTKIAGLQNQLDIKRQASMQAMGYETQATNLQMQGALGVGLASQTAGAEELAGFEGAATAAGGYAAKQIPAPE